MSKKKGWQLSLILMVIALTIYNILPTIIFYTKPLEKPIEVKEAYQIMSQIGSRVNLLEKEAIDWIHSFNKLLGIKAEKVKSVKGAPQFLEVQFRDQKELDTFKHYIARAGNLIPFYPSQLSLVDTTAFKDLIESDSPEKHTLYLKRKIAVKFPENDISSYFQYGKMYENDKSVSKEYLNILEDRISYITLSACGPSENATLSEFVLKQPNDPRADDFLFVLAQNIVSIDTVFGEYNEIAKTFYRTFSQTEAKVNIAALTDRMTSYKDKIQLKKIDLKKQSEQSDEPLLQAEYKSLEAKEELVLKALTLLRNEKAVFSQSTAPLNPISVHKFLANAFSHKTKETESVLISSYNPIVDELVINWNDSSLSLALNKEILTLRQSFEASQDTERLNALEQIIYNEIARISRSSEESFTITPTAFTLKFQDLANSQSFIAMPLAPLAEVEAETIRSLLINDWHPVSDDLKREAYPITSFANYQKLPRSKQSLQLVIYAPSLANESPLPGFKENSIYVIAKDLGKIIKKHEKNTGSEEAIKTQTDFEELYRLLMANGFTGYPGTTYPLPPQFADDYIFEVSDFYLPLLQATREEFKVHGFKKFALLELSDVRQRILTLNKIETSQHEDLLKWRDEYNAAQVNPTLAAYFDVPKPTKNAYFSNFALSFKKYFRGDDRKILHWGMDLSGGKTVQIALRDNNNKIVSTDADIKQGINELYSRINKMGVSDVSIRQEGTSITIDFPGSNLVSASELIKASTMTFNIVNEAFSPSRGSPHAQEVNQFLQEVWNEAVVTGKKDSASVNQIAWSHLYGNDSATNMPNPRSEAAKALYNLGLRLADPSNPDISSAFNDTDSMIALFRGDNYADWHGLSHPLLIVFKNYALEGSNLENVHAGYDPSKGNYLSFGVKNSQTLQSHEKISPQSNLYNWTGVFAKDKIMGSIYEAASNGGGWRMAVVLNGYVVSAPQLESALRDSGMITGHFTQREVAHLTADLKAGSLSFTPEILSEQSITPDLGIQERYQGILATIVALASVIVLMLAYYRFGGVVASVAVVFNLLITWATLQNIGATITLANLAGVILAVGMAVDANVLVFERIREEFAKSKKLVQAITLGYQKAFSAIFDSNITTIIAALILLNFDSGPIKGFAVTLIIGIVSSMFTALFMTRFFFTKWVKNPAHKELKMANLIRGQNFDFLKWGKKALIISTLITVFGVAALIAKKNTILGMDFTGGYAVTIELATTKANTEYRKEVEKALIASGATMQDIQIRELVPSNKLRIFLSTSMKESGKPFYQMPTALSIDHPTYDYETNPELVWLVSTLEKSNLHLTEKSRLTLDQNWKKVSGQMSDTMRNNAVIGLTLALICILVYITLRFEFTYAVSATLGVIFDLLITIAILGILHFIRVPIQLDLNAVGALMTIAGYSLNDTIIVFDRVREDMKSMHRSSFKEIINHALNVTLSRTILTSGTTLVVLLALVLLGGSSIFGFSLIMSIGVIVGTLSTFFIAATFLLYFQRKESSGDTNHEIMSSLE